MDSQNKDDMLVELDEELDFNGSRRRLVKNDDAYALAQSGKKQVLKRRFGLLSMCGLALTSTTSWESIVVTLSVGLANGGPAGLIWGTLLAWIGTGSVFICMGELSSLCPTAAGQYEWAARLSSTKLRGPLSYICGTVTVATWVAAPTLQAYLTSANALALATFLEPSFSPQPWQGLLLSWAVLFVGVIGNTVLGNLLPLIEFTFLILHVIGVFAFIIPIANLGPPGNAYEIFTTFNNGGGWATIGLAFFVGLQGCSGAFVGGDSAIHMAEEVYHANINVAKAVTMAIAINGALSFSIVIVMLYFGGPLDSLLEVEFPWMTIVYQATGSKGAVAALNGYLIFMGLAACISSIASGSRMTWSFARDRGLPFWRHLRRVDRRLAIPMYSIALVSTSAALLLLIQLGSGVVLNIVLSLLVVGFFSSYLCAIGPLLYQRILGNINDPDKNDKPDAPYTWGPWRLSGWFGILNNAFAVVYLLVVGFFNFWPPVVGPDAQSMNWSCLILGGVAILSAAYYLVWARREFSGPVIETTVE